MKTFEQIALECMQRASESKRELPNFRTLIEPKHKRLEREMIERSKPVYSAREQEYLAVLWRQVAGRE